MDKSLEGRVVIVTGAGGGVGEGIAKLAASRGAHVVVNDLGGSPTGEGADAGPAQRVADEIKADGGSAIANTQSVAEWDSAHEIVQSAIDEFGRLDCVVNNAGVLRDVIFHKMSKEDWDIVCQVNLDGPFFMSRAAAPHFKAQESGCFVHLTSTSGLIGNLAQANYSAAKMGVVGLSKSIALDMQRFNVRSNCIAPFAFTRMVGTIPANDERNRERLEIAKRMTPDKIAPLAVGLMLDDAKDVTGQVFASRMNEVMLFSLNRPIRTAQTSDGWTPESVVSHAIPAMRPSFYPLDRSSDVFTWDPF
ncbi:SDR family NAD(P)-dependent oxidoreductase [Aurantiacibacter rhizosphaerae]|uniref:SDR family NAD(P)-dependent oxidoreductase n=1 Tax=Aurantiacibacter rhizosphaerae TaxID=2691582 RepID=A0A844XIB6_9SPHN|nr:SDR family NAD(P)-dependent oxidoreductase [Aurantiacibacter rhizosphaerae]MWV29288.1 SDR family NAD(P)-dependent oxidoreductase [Aurantiacibacter rhizosphaerae]